MQKNQPQSATEIYHSNRVSILGYTRTQKTGHFPNLKPKFEIARYLGFCICQMEQTITVRYAKGLNDRMYFNALCCSFCSF